MLSPSLKHDEHGDRHLKVLGVVLDYEAVGHELQLKGTKFRCCLRQGIIYHRDKCAKCYTEQANGD